MKNLIKVERARHNLTQSDLARIVNVNRQTINSIETMKYIPSGLLMIKIAKYFKVPVEELFILEEDEI